MSTNQGPYDATGDVGGKPFHGWSCECEECQIADEFGVPRNGEIGPREAGMDPNEVHMPIFRGSYVCAVCGQNPHHRIHDRDTEGKGSDHA